MRAPFLNKSSYSQFGFLLHPLYVFVGGDLIILRLAGVILLTTAATVFFSSLFHLPAVSSALPEKNHLFLVVAGSSAVLLEYLSWIPTPNYNLLNIFGMLLALAGWFQIIRLTEVGGLDGWRRPVALATCALGFAITFLVKPPTAATLSVVVTLLTLAFGRRALLHVLVAGFLSCLLVVLVLLAIDGDLSAVITRYRKGLYQSELSQSNHDLAHMLSNSFDLPLGYRHWISLSLMAALGPVVSIALSLDRWPPARTLVCALVLAIQFVLFHHLLASSQENFGVAHWAIGLLTLTGIATTWLFARWRTPSDGADWRYVAVVLAVIIAPLAFAFGTNNPIWWQAAHAGIFWTSAIALFAVLAAPRTMRLPWLHFTIAASACLAVQSVLAAINNPYRITGPLWQQTEWISSANKERAVKGDPVTALYIRTLLHGAGIAGFQVGTPIIDMTGTAPTTLYLLGAEPSGSAWLSGGYPGSRDLALHLLSETPADKLRASWILTAPKGHRALPLDVLQGIGLQFPNAYEEVVRARTSYMDEVHVLWRPRTTKLGESFPQAAPQ